MGWRNIWIQWRFHKIYKEDSALGYFIEADVQQTEKLHELHSDLPFFSWMNQNRENWKTYSKMHNKKEYVMHIRNLKQAVKHRLVLKKVHRVIIFNQKAWLNSYIDMKKDLRKNTKNDFKKDLEKLWKMWEDMEISSL